jgi:hypothetical protein
VQSAGSCGRQTTADSASILTGVQLILVSFRAAAAAAAEFVVGPWYDIMRKWWERSSAFSTRIIDLWVHRHE